MLGRGVIISYALAMYYYRNLVCVNRMLTTVHPWRARILIVINFAINKN